MDIKRLRALEKKWRRESATGFDGDGNLSDTWTAQAMRSCADELAAILSARQAVAPIVLADDLWRAMDAATDPADFLARAIAILQQRTHNMAMVDNTAMLRATASEQAPVAIGEIVESEVAGNAISFPNGYSVTLDTLAIGTKIYAGTPPTGGEHMAIHWIDRYAAGIDDEPQIDLIRDALTSPAHTSEARDALMAWAVKNDVAAGECDPNRRVIPLAALNQYAAMRQEAE